MIAPPANPRKTTGVRALGQVDIAALRQAVAGLSAAQWAAHDAHKPNRFDVLGMARHIVLRFIDDPRDWRGSHDCPPWAAWRALVQPVLDRAVAPYGYAAGVFPRVMLACLPAGAVIAPHIDANPAARWPHKIHVPLATNPQVVCWFGGAAHHFPVGQAVEVDNLAPHGVRNGGQSDRVHLIFEYADAEWGG